MRWAGKIAIGCALVVVALPQAALADPVDFFATRWPTQPTASYETGMRYWYGWAKTGKDLYDTSGSLSLSRLTYDGMTIHAPEAFLRADQDRGVFVKGYVGGAWMVSGNLRDEDFPPVTSPYSSTNSQLAGSTLIYGSVDLGYRVVRGGDFDIGAFVGYHYLREYVGAYGCSQTGNNGAICGTAIPETYAVISQTNNWHSLRLGLDARWQLSSRLRLDVEGAWLPYLMMKGADSHWLRIGTDFTGPVPEDGTGWGYQFEGVLSYQVSDKFSLGLGGRYWHMQTTHGHTHFEDHIIGGVGYPQELRWSTDSYGVFLQGSLKLGPDPSPAF